ncbi:DGF-1-like protein, putative [Bodo saltans]|uniref:DGF-1-like protein, putative n=1 Tax=Bodo saltans TaxID=75058 RepID=A0A0S4JER8_BODSA|nr:DGF-1-like protein, putative [Bodo saltans]|eukprot:CUG87664.1 DGF-1-like protein, putative [Bodo saltans]
MAITITTTRWCDLQHLLVHFCWLSLMFVVGSSGGGGGGGRDPPPPPTPAPCSINCGTHGTANKQSCKCVCDAGYSGPFCGTYTCTNARDCNGHASSVTGNSPSTCVCACVADWGGPSCGYNASLYCRMIGTSLITADGSSCECICKPGFSGPRCQRTASESYSRSLIVSVSQDDSTPTATASGTRTKPTPSHSVALSSGTPSLSAGHSASISPSQDRPSASITLSTSVGAKTGTVSATMQKSLSMSRPSLSAVQTLSSTADTASLILSATSTSSMTIRLSASGVTHSITASISSQLSSSTKSATPTSWLSASHAHSKSKSIGLTVTHPPSMTHDITLSRSWSTSFSLTVSSSDSKSHTRSYSVSRVSARITESLTCAMAPRVTIIPSTDVIREAFLSLEKQQQQQYERRSATTAVVMTDVVSTSQDSDNYFATPIISDPLRSLGQLEFSRCLFKADAEVTLSNSTLLPCMELNAASIYSLKVLPPNRGPPPPFLIALPYSVDANWILRFQTNITSESAMLRPDDLMVDIMNATATSSTVQMQSDSPITSANTITTLFTSSVLLDNATNLTSRTGTLFLRVDATPEWM